MRDDSPLDDIEAIVAAAAEPLDEDERAFLDHLAGKATAYPLQFAESAWFYLHDADRVWTPDMEAYRRALAARRQHEVAARDLMPLDPSAAQRRHSLMEMITLRGD